MVLNQTLMFEAGLFATSALLIYSLSGLLIKPGADPVLQRLRADAGAARPGRGRKEGSAPAGLGPLITRVGEAASRPFMPNRPENQSELRRQLGYAGLYGPSLVRVFV